MAQGNILLKKYIAKNVVKNIIAEKARFNLHINFLEYWQKDSEGKIIQHFSWVTDIKVHKKNAKFIMKAGRARWRIENEIFNTLKNQGYHFEHNYGHGNRHLCSVFTMLMMLSFLIDQTQMLCCPLFQAAKKSARTYRDLGYEMRTLFRYALWETRESFYYTIAHVSAVELKLNTS